MLRLEDIVVSVGGQELLRGIDWHLRPDDRVGLVGRNGSGKTTLLRVITGEVPPESGTVHRRGSARVGYLPQQAVSGSTRPLWDEVRVGMTRLNRLQADLALAEAALEAGAEGAVERHAQVADAFRLAGGYAIEERVGEVLAGLGFVAGDWQRTCDVFSGGWQMRIALARLLLSEPDVLLLDEPTNHLDLQARSWLAGFLAKWSGPLVIVSHDRHILDRVCTRTVEIRHGRLYEFAGNFSAWLAERERREVHERAAFEQQQAEIARLERFVDRFRYKATKAAQAQSRQKVLDRMERLAAPESEARAPRLRLPEAPPGALEAVSLGGATLGWPDKPGVLSGVDLAVVRGMRVAVLGLNGSGKSTLLRALAGRLPLQAGRRVVGRGVRIGLFTQDLAQELPLEANAAEYCREQAPAAGDQRVRDVLGALGLSGDAALRPIGALSGGERARVALAVHVLRPRNLLLLDEPSNHLDAVTVAELVRALHAYEGALVIISHDRYLVEQVATHVLLVGGGRAVLREGVRTEDFEPARLGDLRAGSGTKNEVGAQDHAARKAEQRRREGLRKRVEEIGRALEAAEADLSALDERMAAASTDHAALARMAREREGLEARIDALYAEWQQTESALDTRV